MTEQNLEQSRLRDALSDVTRKARRFLLGTSMLGIALIKTGIVPSKISALGIELQGADQRALLDIVAFVILYFLTAFIIYATSDYLTWRLSISRQAIERAVSSYEEDLKSFFPQPGTVEEELEKFKERLHAKILIYFKLVTPISIVRALFDFGLPIVVGGYALILLVRAVAGGGT